MYIHKTDRANFRDNLIQAADKNKKIQIKVTEKEKLTYWRSLLNYKKMEVQRNRVFLKK